MKKTNLLLLYILITKHQWIWLKWKNSWWKMIKCWWLYDKTVDEVKWKIVISTPGVLAPFKPTTFDYIDSDGSSAGRAEDCRVLWLSLGRWFDSGSSEFFYFISFFIIFSYKHLNTFLHLLFFESTTYSQLICILRIQINHKEGHVRLQNMSQMWIRIIKIDKQLCKISNHGERPNRWADRKWTHIVYDLMKD